MRVGVNTLFLIPGEVGGSETYLRETLKALVVGHPAIELTLFTNRENDLLWRNLFGAYPQVAYSKLDFQAANRFQRIVREQVQLPGLVRRAGVDVLWSPGYTAPFWAPCPQVVSILDMQYKNYPEDMTPLACWVTDVLVRTAARRSRALLTLSDFSKQEILRYIVAHPENITVTHLAVDVAFGNPVPPELVLRVRQSLLGFQEPYILCVANTYPHKNVAALVDAFGRLQGRAPYRLVLVGKPRLGEPDVQQSLNRLADGARIKRVEQVSHDELVALYQLADVFVFPSLYEGFGLPVLEAMMAGVPVVTTRCGSLPEVGGDVVQYADTPDAEGLAAAIRRVWAWSDGQRRDALAAARRHAGTFIWSRTAAQTLRVLEQAGIKPT